MINYATQDVLAVTYLIRPILENWKFETIKARESNEICIEFESINLPPLPVPVRKKKIKNLNVGKLSRILSNIDPDLESISSDDEIYCDQLLEPISNDRQPESQVEKYDIVGEIQDQDMVQPQSEDATRDEDMNGQVNDDRSSVDHHLVEVNEVEIPPNEQQQRRKITRSKQAKKRRNKKKKQQDTSASFSILVQKTVLL